MSQDNEAIMLAMMHHLAEQDIYIPSAALRGAIAAAFPPAPESPARALPVVESVQDARVAAQIVAQGLADPAHAQTPWLDPAKNREAIAKHPAGFTMTDAARDVFVERERQVSGEGCSHTQDDAYVNGELVGAAIAYALSAMRELVPAAVLKDQLARFWPWGAHWWKPHGKRRDLVRAGALILAEIERLDRGAVRKAA
jgi:hypothetical protein